MIASGLLAVVIVLLVASDAQAKIPANATTSTNVCVVYEHGGTFDGGLPVMEPQTVSYRHLNDVRSALLWLAGRERIRVDSLAVVPVSSTGECESVLAASGQTGIIEHLSCGDRPVNTGEEVRCSASVNGGRTLWQAPGGDPLAGTGTLSSSISVSPEGVQDGSDTIAGFTTVYDASRAPRRYGSPPATARTARRASPPSKFSASRRNTRFTRKPSHRSSAPHAGLKPARWSGASGFQASTKIGPDTKSAQ